MKKSQKPVSLTELLSESLHNLNRNDVDSSVNEADVDGDSASEAFAYKFAGSKVVGQYNQRLAEHLTMEVTQKLGTLGSKFLRAEGIDLGAEDIADIASNHMSEAVHDLVDDFERQIVEAASHFMHAYGDLLYRAVRDSQSDDSEG